MSLAYHKSIVLILQWDIYFRNGSRATLSLLQAALTCQTFGMSSGNSKDLCEAEALHGAVIAWSHQAGLFRNAMVFNTESEVDLEASWKTWAHVEQRIRVSHLLHIHDAKLAMIFHHEPFLQHNTDRLPACYHDEVFAAVSAAAWQQAFTTRVDERIHPQVSALQPDISHKFKTRGSILYSLSYLSSVIGSIQEFRLSGSSNHEIKQFRQQLLIWYRENHEQPKTQDSMRISLLIVWHAAFLSLYTDFDLLQQFIGRDGVSSAELARSQARLWASSLDAQRSVIHSLLILQHTEAFPISFEPHPHISMALFQSATVIYCYFQLRPHPETGNALSWSTLVIPELQEINLPWFRRLQQLLSSAASFSPGTSIIHKLIDILRRIGHWGISQIYASILETMIQSHGCASFPPDE
jgi:hypothetical protein